MKLLRYVFLIFCSIVLIYFFTPYLYSEFLFLRGSSHAQGAITAVKSVHHPTGFHTWKRATRVNVEVFFKDKIGGENWFEGYVLYYGVKNPDNYRNKNIPVLYETRNPQNAKVADFIPYWSGWITFLILVISSSFILFHSLLKILFSLKRGRSNL